MTERFSEQSGLSSVFFRTTELLFCRRQRCGSITVYAGVDYLNREGDFLSKCCGLLTQFEAMDIRWYRVFARHVGRIIGSDSYTRFWDFPRCLEMNYTDVLDCSVIDFAGLLVCETTRARLHRALPKRRRDEDRICRVCFRQEIRFREHKTGKRLTETERAALLNKKPWTPRIRRQILEKALGTLKDCR